MHAPRRYRNPGDLPAVIPVFPLTGVLLLPKTRLPLNIFEPRYIAMVDSAISSYRMIGMIQPKVPGEEEDAAKKPALAAVGCVGRIVEYSETDDGRYLVTRRLTGTHLAGYWEFPGGKCADGESLIECLTRELVEELAVEARVGDEIYGVEHEYPDRVVELHFFRCALEGEPTAVLGQEMRWVPRGHLRALEFPPADAELIARLTAT